MVKRVWGETQDKEAARQLSLSGDHTIFMMGTEADYAGDIREAVQKFEDRGYVDAGEVMEAVEEYVRPVSLPSGFVMVGMKPVDADEPKVYGVVDFSMFGRS